MDLLDRLIDATEANFNWSNGTISVDVLGDKDGSVAFLIPPTTPIDHYLDKTIQNEFLVAIKVKGKKQRDIINKCQDIADFLVSIKALASSNNSFEFIDASIYSSVAFVSKTENDMFIYSATVKFLIYSN